MQSKVTSTDAALPSPAGGARRRRRASNRQVGLLVGAATVAVVLAAWWLISALQLVSPLFVPSPQSVWQAFVDTSTQPYRGHLLWQHVAISLWRVLLAFVAAVLVAVPMGLLIGSYRWVDAVFQPLINFYRPLPPLAYYTLLVIWLGIGDSSKVALLFLAGFPPLVINSAAGVRAVRGDLLRAAGSLGAKRWQIFVYVVLPASLPQIFTGVRVALGFTYTTLVAAEIVAATSGIGWLVLDASRFLRSDLIFMGIIVMGLTGMALDYVVVLAEHRLVPWLGKA